MDVIQGFDTMQDVSAESPSADLRGVKVGDYMFQFSGFKEELVIMDLRPRGCVRLRSVYKDHCAAETENASCLGFSPEARLWMAICRSIGLTLWNLLSAVGWVGRYHGSQRTNPQGVGDVLSGAISRSCFHLYRKISQNLWDGVKLVKYFGLTPRTLNEDGGRGSTSSRGQWSQNLSDIGAAIWELPKMTNNILQGI